MLEKLKAMFTKSPTDTSGAKILDVNDYKSLAINAGLVGLSAVITYVIDNAASLDFGAYTQVIGPVVFLVLKAAQKWLKDNTKA